MRTATQIYWHSKESGKVIGLDTYRKLKCEASKGENSTCLDWLKRNDQALEKASWVVILLSVFMIVAQFLRWWLF